MEEDLKKVAMEETIDKLLQMRQLRILDFAKKHTSISDLIKEDSNNKYTE